MIGSIKQLLFLVLFFGAFSASAGTTSNLNKAGVILDGFDAVSYFQLKEPVKGKPEFQAKQGDATYWFSSEADKNEFLKNPKKYEPQYGGWCAYAVATSSSKVDVDPKSYVIQEGRLLLFYKAIWANTRDKWLNTKGKDSKAYLNEADTNWPSTSGKEP